MYLNFKKWINGNDEMHAVKLNHVDAKFKKFIEDLGQYGVDKESIFIYGMLNLLHHLHKDEKKHYNHLRILLETYIIYLRGQPNFKNHHLAPLQISTLFDGVEIHLYGIYDPEVNWCPERNCHNLVESLSNYIEGMVVENRKSPLFMQLHGLFKH